ncbi:Cytochrome P450 6a2-like Protein [Tribolium castaneum]|uniref:Cytochrome P450 6a2-like Protein n=1 Tax=Tribolium castaneum TaxID=7070 RepID=A0A139WGV5_TRICA|nr:Cytochrome P450 6a2-like Protein [Tribolium castaneum]
MFFTQSLLTDVTTLVVTLTVILVTYYKWSYTYWRRRGVPSLTPKIPWGNLSNPLNRKDTIGVDVKKMYDSMRRQNWKHGGVFFMASPVYLVTDLEYVKDILTKNFQNFVDRGLYYNEKDDPISAHLFAIGGPKWRNLRTKLTPTFTSGKMKAMFQTLLDCESNLQEKVAAELGKNQAIDIKDVFGCFTTDVIGSCAFGLDCNTFKEADSPFRKYGKKVFTNTPIRQLKSSFSNSFPKLAQQFGISVMPKDVSDFFTKVVKDTVEYRQKNNYTRKDFMQLLIDLKGEGKQDGKSLTMDEITAQSFLFFAAGFETSSTTVTFALYELAKHQDIQQKVREEIETVLAKFDGKVTYEAIQEMHYMNQVLNGTNYFINCFLILIHLRTVTIIKNDTTGL